ncbi:430_t:CDS:1 [Scutellospora calospora]|uniref:430_t:CDS:1 n=1 Tax=Scutellospora calospora TaxID=85575 RepID=A0ACA9KM82_9GLOM|nr:430_t:CDS:1 [Scutellospora calospora]
MNSSNTLSYNKQSSVYYKEKYNSLSLPSPPPLPHESTLGGLFGISEVSPKFDTINNALFNSQQNEMANTFFPPIKYLLDSSTDNLDQVKKTESTNKKIPSHCLSRFSLSNTKSSPLKTNHIVSELIFDKSLTNIYKTFVNRHQNTFNNNNNPHPTQVTLKTDSSIINSPQPAPKPESYEFLSEKDIKLKTQELNTLTTHRSSQQRPRSGQTKRSGTSAPQRKRKGNSLSRVMADQGLLESVFNINVASNDIKSVRIPLQFDELMSNINALDLDNDVLEKISPEISWKGQPLSITHLPHNNVLHPTEARIVSILRLTPLQYLTGKYTLVSAAHRYAQRALPFKKSDAQKLLRIDVNKASKLWEFFNQVHWI